jgi:peptide-methionine (R)-S-oxide reductase
MKSILLILLFGSLCSCSAQTKQDVDNHVFPIQKSEAEWRKELSEQTYYVMRKKGTERAFSGEYNAYKGEGIFLCAACSNPLFSGKHKFDSGTGWPSFYQAIDKKNVVELEENSLGMTRTEVLCAHCGGHLGHVFPDGPKPTGLRYCINSVALKLK